MVLDNSPEIPNKIELQQPLNFKEIKGEMNAYIKFQ